MVDVEEMTNENMKVFMQEMTMGERKQKIFNKVDELKNNRNKNDSLDNSSTPSRNQSTINLNSKNKATKQTITLNISIPPTKRKTRIKCKQNSKTTTSSTRQHNNSVT